jgi:hypothetical protein
MTTFTWTIANLERTNDDAKGVVVAHYRVDGVDGEHTMGAYGSQSFTPDPSADDYVAFADLTEATVVGWVQNALGGAEKVAEIETALQGRIDEQRSPATVSGLPWAAAE